MVCALRSLSIMGGIQNLIICVKMAWREHLDCGVIFVNYAVEIYDFALNLSNSLQKKSHSVDKCIVVYFVRNHLHLVCN